MIRPFDAADLAEVLDIWYRASLIAHPFLDDDFMARERVQIAERWVPIAETIVFDDGDGVVGFLSLVGDEVGAIFVDPDRHGGGVGRALMDEAHRRRGALELNVFVANAIGRRFYAAYGFVEVGRHMNETAGHPEIRLRLGADHTPSTT